MEQELVECMGRPAHAIAPVGDHKSVAGAATGALIALDQGPAGVDL
jgi:hypothetical protein